MPERSRVRRTIGAKGAGIGVAQVIDPKDFPRARGGPVLARGRDGGETKIGGRMKRISIGRLPEARNLPRELGVMSVVEVRCKAARLTNRRRRVVDVCEIEEATVAETLPAVADCINRYIGQSMHGIDIAEQTPTLVSPSRYSRPSSDASDDPNSRRVPPLS
jgi:hypothetical protein